MYSHYEPRQGGITRDYELVNEFFNTISNTGTTYQSAISPHVTYVQRSRPLAFGSRGHMTQVYPNFRAAREGDAFGSDLFALADFYTTRQHEKHELEQLNDKFAQDSSRTKEMYDTERNEASKLIDSTNSDVDAANVSVQQAEQEVKRLRVRYHEVTSLRETDRVLFIN
ncbi:unnamed protein product [Rotaria sp. Silwood2]|nr:unnamed protein product [Rotaria sp. Silwood2]